MAKVLTDRRCVELEELVSFISFFNTLYYREAPQSKLLIKEFEALSKTNSKMSVQVQQCTLTDEHLEPIVCVYPAKAKKGEA